MDMPIQNGPLQVIVHRRTFIADSPMPIDGLAGYRAEDPIQWTRLWNCGCPPAWILTLA